MRNPHPHAVIAACNSVECPCGRVLDTMFKRTESTTVPRPGDWSMCLDCGRLYRLDESLTLVLVSEEVIALLPSSTQKNPAL